MPITIELRENNRVIYSEFIFPYTLADAVEAQKKDAAMRDSCDHTIHAILNLSSGGNPPLGLMRVAKESPSLKHPRHGQLIVFGANFFSTTLVQLASKLANKRYEFIRFAKNEDEAWSIIRQIIAAEDKQGIPTAK